MEVNAHKNGLRKLFLGALSFSLLFNIVITCYFKGAAVESDDLTLFNPVYMFLNQGEMTYPVHGWLNGTIVHPPTRYYTIALLMKAGFNSFYAFVTPLVILVLLFISIVLFSPFEYKVKVSFILSLILLVFFNLYSIRPDIPLALTWACGLLLLEYARQQNWNGTKLFFGSFLITYASCLHYYASFAFLGITVYIIWAFKTLPALICWRKILAIAAGSALCGIPYLVFYVIPNFSDIMLAVKLNQAEGGFSDAIIKHLMIYRSIFTWQVVNPDDWTYAPPSLIFIGIFFLIVTAVAYWQLYKNASAKGIFLASLPLIILVLFYSRGKSPGYFFPELIMIVAGIFLGLFSLASKFLTNRIPDGIVNIGYVLGSIFVLFLSSADALFNGRFIKKDIEMHLTRACAKEIVGKNALIGGRMSAWYISGASVWYNVSQDLMSANILPDNTEAYFTNFDAIAETHHMSNYSLNPEQKTILSWYENGNLKLTGFYMSDNGGFASELATIFFQTEKTKKVLGFGCIANEKLFRFDEDSLGNYVFVSFILPKIPENTTAHLDALVSKTLLLNYMALPDPGGVPGRINNDVKNEIIFMLISLKDYHRHKSVLPADVVFIDIIPGKISDVNKEVMLQKSEELDTPMKFPQSLQDALEEKSKLAHL